VASERVERRLAAILAADVAGYSRLTSEAEEETHLRLKEHLRVLIDPKITEYRGRVVKNTGDGMLAEFSSVVDAVRCAVEIQRGMAQRNIMVPEDKRIEFRIGVNLGDVIVDSGDIFGCGVNVAVRLEGLGDPGSICVSERVKEYAQDQLDVLFEDAGEHQLKNIARPVRAYHVRFDRPAKKRTALTVPSKPSIAVLPFENLSGDPEQEYFADGMVEEIITALSRFRELFVIARNSSFAYQGRAVDVKQVGRDLGVRYVLEGSVRKCGSRLRIMAQLIDASAGTHLWADRFGGGLEDIFELQDRVTEAVVAAVAPKLQHLEIERAKRKPTENLDAYDFFLRGMAEVYPRPNTPKSRAAAEEALHMFRNAIEMDPNFASAYGLAAWCYALRKSTGWGAERVDEIAEAERLARVAVRLGNDDALALSTAAHALGYVVGDYDASAAAIDRAIALNSNLALVWYCDGWVRLILGQPEAAIETFTRYTRLSPLDPFTPYIQAGMAFAYFLIDQYDKGLSWAEKSFQEFKVAHTFAAYAANALFAGRAVEAKAAVLQWHEIDPEMRLCHINDLFPTRKQEYREKILNALRNAGLPE
jgi:TolB-like protein